jgi:hypothetical protein
MITGDEGGLTMNRGTWLRTALLVGLCGLGCQKVAKDLRASKRSEATIMLQKIANSAKRYYVELAGGTPRFPESAPLTPPTDCCAQGGRCTPDPTTWSAPAWSALAFSMDDPHYFQYEFTSSGSGDDATFTARAVGRPGCEGDPVTYQVTGKVSAGQVEISGP